MRLSCEFPQPPRFALAYGSIAPKTVDNHRLRARALHGITNGLNNNGLRTNKSFATDVFEC